MVPSSSGDCNIVTVHEVLPPSVYHKTVSIKLVCYTILGDPDIVVHTCMNKLLYKWKFLVCGVYRLV